MQSWERATKTPQHQPIEWKKGKGKQQETKSERAARPKKGIGPALATSHSHTIEHGVTKIVPQRYWQGNKSPAILWGSAARRRISVPMCDHSAVWNLHRHIRHRKGIIKKVHRVTPDLVQHTWYCLRSTMCKVTLKHTPVKTLAPLTKRSSILRCVSVAEHQMAEQYSKTVKTKNH